MNAERPIDPPEPTDEPEWDEDAAYDKQREQEIEDYSDLCDHIYEVEKDRQMWESKK